MGHDEILHLPRTFYDKTSTLLEVFDATTCDWCWDNSRANPPSTSAFCGECAMADTHRSTVQLIRERNIAKQCRAIAAISKSVAVDLQEIRPAAIAFISWLKDGAENANIIARSFEVERVKQTETYWGA